MMNSLNSILLEGNLVQDAQVNQAPNGKYSATFAIATVRNIITSDTTYEKEESFFEVEAFGEIAELCIWLAKGRAVRVCGRLKQGRWVDSEGNNHSKIKIVAEHIEMKPARTSIDEE